MKKYLTKNNILYLVLIILFILIALWNNSGFYDLGRWTLYSFVPLMMIAMGGLYSERSGVVNIALEGMAIFGAFVGILTLSHLQKANIDGQVVLILMVFLGGIAGLLFSLLHSFASISLKSNQVISGTALNMMALALAIFLGRILSRGGTEEIQFADNYRITSFGILSKIPVIGDIFFTRFYIISLLGILLYVIAAVVAYKTKFGLRMRSCGENPHAADAAGINVYKIRYISVSVSGFMAGAAGVILIIPTTTSFWANVYGFGFLALAVLISGQWKPLRIVVFSLLFAFLKNLSAGINVVSNTFYELSLLDNFLSGFNKNMYQFFRTIPPDIINLMPFAVTLFILALTSKKSQGPKAAGEPYDQGKR